MHPITALQTEWSLWSREIEARDRAACRELGIGVVPYSPLGRGALTGTITSRDDLPRTTTAATMPRFAEGAIDANLATLDVVRAIAAGPRRHARPGRAGLAARQGARRRADPGHPADRYLEQNAPAATVTLTGEQIERLDAITVIGSREVRLDGNWTDGVTPALRG